MGADLLDMAYINSLPQPFFMKKMRSDKYGWPVHDIEVQSGLLRIDVCGLLDVLHITDAAVFIDANGVEHSPDDFYSDAEREKVPQ